jgi:DNA-binding NtrC family response regulator
MVIKKRVLVVDDKPGVIRFVQINPAPAGYEAISVIYREQALPPVRSEKQDNTLLDILMAQKASPSFA